MGRRAVNKGNGRSSENLWLEREFLQAPNALFENLARTSLSPNESKVIHLIIRKTFGWNKIEDWISLSQMVEGTDITKPKVCRTLNSLKRRNIIERPDSKHIGLQLDYSLWIQSKGVRITVKLF